MNTRIDHYWLCDLLLHLRYWRRGTVPVLPFLRGRGEFTHSDSVPEAGERAVETRTVGRGVNSAGDQLHRALCDGAGRISQRAADYRGRGVP